VSRAQRYLLRDEPVGSTAAFSPFVSSSPVCVSFGLRQPKMKFGQYLSYNLIPEWRDYLLNYGVLSAAIKRIHRQIEYERQKRSLSSDQTEQERTRLFEATESGQDLFVILLDSELEKINQFYLKKEKHLQATLSLYANSTGDGSERKKSGFTRSQLETLYNDVDGLKNYVILNYIAIKKILRKYEKYTGRSYFNTCMKRVERMPFCKSTTLSALMTEIERLYAENFTDGNMDKAKRRLNPSWYSGSELFTTGVLLGMAVPLFVLLLVVLIISPATTALPNFFQNFPVFRSIALPLVLCWLWGLSLFFWMKTKINYVYVLEIDPKTKISYLAVFRLAAVGTVMWMTAFLLYVGAAKGKLQLLSIPYNYYPALLVMLSLGLLVLPLNVLHRSARYGLFATLFQVLITPFGSLRFKDFFLADVLCSFVRPAIDLGYTGCWLGTGVWLSDGNNDSTITKYAICQQVTIKYFNPIISYLPYWIRFLQCLRKYKETKRVFPHILNAMKYFTSIIAITFATVNSFVFNDNWGYMKWIWIVAIAVSSVYSFLWDVCVDWGLGQWQSKNWLLRDVLLVGRGYYYLAIVLDLFGRFFWAFTLEQTSLIRPDFFVIVISTVEIARRAMWGFFRVEYETLSNYEQYRQFDLVPKFSNPFKTKSLRHIKPTAVRGTTDTNRSSMLSLNDLQTNHPQSEASKEAESQVLTKEHAILTDDDFFVPPLSQSVGRAVNIQYHDIFDENMAARSLVTSNIATSSLNTSDMQDSTNDSDYDSVS
jgi:hypothetical protein